MELKTAKELETTLKDLKSKTTGKIYIMEIPVNDSADLATLYLKKPERKTYEAGASVLSKSELRGTEVFLRGMYLGGDNLEEIIKDVESLRASTRLLMDLLAIKEGNVREA